MLLERDCTYSDIEVNEIFSSFFINLLTRTKSKYEGINIIVWEDPTADFRSIGKV